MGTAFLTTQGDDGETLVPLENPVTLGSAWDCDLRVKNAAPRHAQIVRTAEGYVVRDLTGQGLVRVNGLPTARQVLLDGDRVSVGGEEFRFTVDESAAPIVVAAPPPARKPAKKRKQTSTTHLPVISPPPPQAARPRIPMGAIAAGAAVLVAAAALAVLLTSKKSPPPVAVAKKAPAPPRPAPKEVRPQRREMPESPVDRPVDRSTPLPELAPPVAPDPAALFTPRPSLAPTVPAGLGAMLKDPIRRSSSAERASMAASIVESGHRSPVLRALGHYFSRPDAAWGLTAAAQEAWARYLQECPVDRLAELTADEHLAMAKILLEAGPSPLPRLVALAHLLESGPELPAAHGFRRSVDGRLWGDADAMAHYALSRQVGRPAKEEAAPEMVSSFGARYALALLQIQKTLDRGAGYEAAVAEFVTTPGPGAPRNASEHLKALALSFRNAVRCRECKEGRLACPQCQGKAKIDLPCAACQGTGRTIAPGAVDGAQVTQKCRNCDGKRIFKDVGCPTCAKAGSIPCGSCGGRVWKDGGCTNPSCRGGLTPCVTCGKRGRVDLRCADCGGTGRVTAPGAVDGARVTQKCRTCNENHGIFKLAAPCSTCAASGWVKCDTCKGKPAEVKSSIPLSAVYTTERCRDCSGEGWPWAPLPAACPACAGLGVRIRPAADPAKLLQ